MKAPAFWYRQESHSFMAGFLSPLSAVWTMGAVLRRRGVLPFRPIVPLICVGNVVAGGAGKTPVALTIARWLIAQGHRPVFVTRGYGGRITAPSRVVRGLHVAADVGDEALLLACVAPTYIGSDRARTVALAQQVATHIIMDDGLQNPSVEPWLRLLVVDAERGFGNGRIIPAGPLREPVEVALQRIDAVIVMQSGRSSWRSGLLDQLRESDVLIARGQMRQILPATFPMGGRFLAFAGIGRPQKFFETCRALSLNVVQEADYPDHHPYSSRDLGKLEKMATAQDALLLTTEKDWVRLPPDWRDKVLTISVTAEIDGVDTIMGLLTPQ